VKTTLEVFVIRISSFIALTCRIMSLLFFLFAGVIRRIMDTLWFDDFWVKPVEANRRYGWRKFGREPRDEESEVIFNF